MRGFSILIALAVCGGVFLSARADVTGHFDLNINVNPVACGALPFASFGGNASVPVDCEATLTKTDFETLAGVNLALSGLTLGLEMVSGFTGIERLLKSFKATLGVLNLTDQFFFAVPFGTDLLVIHNSAGTQTDSETAFTVISPGNLLFVAKRISASFTLGGLTLTNLAELADLGFPQVYTWPYPCAAQLGALYGTPGKCPFLPSQSSFPGGYASSSQSFHFGDTLTLTGQTVSGISLTHSLALGMDPSLFADFKKVSFPGAVCDNFFAQETISLAGLRFAPVALSERLDLRFPGGSPCRANVFYFPQPPLTSETDLSLDTALGALAISLSTANPTQQLVQSVLVTLSRGSTSIQEQFDDSLAPLYTRIIFTTTINVGRNPGDLTVGVIICQKIGMGLFAGYCPILGLQELETRFQATRSGVTFTLTSDILRTGGGISLDLFEFVLSGGMGVVHFKADISVLPVWNGLFSAGISF